MNFERTHARSHPEQTGRKESPENGVIETGFEHLIGGSRLIGRGKDAVVFRLSAEDVPAEELEALVVSGVLPDMTPESLAAKILKVYDPGKGIQEFSMQQKARELVEGSAPSESSDTPLCGVPEAFIARDQHLTEHARETLNRYGTELADQAELLVMDYVDGKDLGTIMYDFVLTKNGFDADSVEFMSYEEKEQQVGLLLGFEISSRTGKTPEEINSERSIVFARNEQKLITYLKRGGFKLDPGILDAVERTVRVWHEAQFFHNDLHKRNIMVDRNGRTHIIDFGQAGPRPEEGLDDLASVHVLRTLCHTEEDERALRHQADKKIYQDVLRRMYAAPTYKMKLEALEGAVARSGTQALERELASSVGKDAVFERLLIMLGHLLGREKTRRETEKFIQGLAEGHHSWRPAEKNMIKRFNDSGFWKSFEGEANEIETSI